ACRWCSPTAGTSCISGPRRGWRWSSSGDRLTGEISGAPADSPATPRGGTPPMHHSLLVTTLVTALMAVLAACSGGHSASAPPPRLSETLVVGCDNVIGHARPFTEGYRRVLGVIAAPPAYIPQVVHAPQGRW